MKISQQFRVVRRPREVVSRYAIIVVHNNGLPHRPLTTFYHELQQYVADGTAHTYLNALIPYFSYLINDQPVLQPKPKGGFQVQRRRWVVERTLAWLSRFRRLARDYEGLPSSSEALIQVATIRLFLTRLAPFRY